MNDPTNGRLWRNVMIDTSASVREHYRAAETLRNEKVAYLFVGPACLRTEQ
jgi:hypothetical protein